MLLPASTLPGDKALLAEIEAKVEEVAGHRERVLSALRKLGHTPPGPTSRNCSGSSEGSSRRQPPGGGQGDEESVRGGLADLAALWAHVPHAEYLHAGKAQALLRIGRCGVQPGGACEHMERALSG